ncbi:hypothetical protein Pmar_PMAR022667 [Perkinsus marinus ATCC 50983]|uniref:Uncharacterized protein n=1 Tax=Perkinsus marinus (strain ATCC 50983 / TXsc) TaxID=423536 RepID=C5LSB5_PERM5|nr:hypothetical protein Pmar_PMAR022667 [Perkinsus marinus ATCC 50983]EER00379.1 hypothetical protein Pmar_PMAR022667 [Perkinsus marinus ATCC 50983]|eukprot:XP_002767661.1 hypothetical protein Pmar_PMAR022667 [Perkinsus marinus ATCC 50983]
MVNSLDNDALELALGRLDLEPSDTAEIRKWLNSPALGSCFSSYDFVYDPIDNDRLDDILSKLLELDAVPPAEARNFVSLWAGAIVTMSPPLEDGEEEDPVDYARNIFSEIFHGGLVHGERLPVTLWLATVLATASTKRRFRLARSTRLGNERLQGEALVEALLQKGELVVKVDATGQTHETFMTPHSAEGLRTVCR